jgi:hypothetical protein
MRLLLPILLSMLAVSAMADARSDAAIVALRNQLAASEAARHKSEDQRSRDQATFVATINKLASTGVVAVNTVSHAVDKNIKVVQQGSDSNVQAIRNNGANAQAAADTAQDQASDLQTMVASSFKAVAVTQVALVAVAFLAFLGVWVKARGVLVEARELRKSQLEQGEKIDKIEAQGNSIYTAQVARELVAHRVTLAALHTAMEVRSHEKCPHLPETVAAIASVESRIEALQDELDDRQRDAATRRQ